MFLGYVIAYFGKVVAVEVNEPAAAQTFQVEMIVTATLGVNILIAGAGLAVKGVLSHYAFVNELVKLTIYSRNAHRSALCVEKCAYLLNVGMFFLIFNEVIQQLFLLLCIIAGIAFHYVSSRDFSLLRVCVKQAL